MEGASSSAAGPRPAAAHPDAHAQVHLVRGGPKGAVQQNEGALRDSYGAGGQHAAGEQRRQEGGQPPLAARSRPRPSRFWLVAWLIGGVALALLVAVILLVLWRSGIIWSGGADWEPLPYAPRVTAEAATPAYRASLHPRLLPAEQAALGLSLDTDVIVIGAGAAGLQAALTLTSRMRVLVLEARDRVGGRIHTVPFGSGLAELGAQFIWGSESHVDSVPRRPGNRVTEIANRIGLERVAMGEGDAYRELLASNGAPLTQQRRTALQRWEADLAALVGTLPANVSLADVMALPQLAARTGAEGLPLLQAALEARLGAQHGGALAQLSAHYHDNQTSPGGVDSQVLGGYSRVPAWLAARLPSSRLRLRTPVAAVRHGDTNATVLLASGQALTAQYVISTVPVGVLRAGGLALDPGLPPQAAAALAATGVGQLEKLWLEFDEIFWEGSGLCGAGAMRAPCETIDVLVPPPPEGGLAWRRWLSVAANTRRPVLVGLVAGESAQRWAGMSDAQIVSSAMAALAAAFPGRAPAAPRAHLVTRWGSDPWSRGALSYPAAGGRGPSDRATLAEPLSGSLLLAGEAAWGEQAGSVHGALLSGQEAALRVLDATSELPTCGSTAGGSGVCVAAVGDNTPQCECDAPEE